MSGFVCNYPLRHSNYNLSFSFSDGINLTYVPTFRLKKKYSEKTYTMLKRTLGVAK